MACRLAIVLLLVCASTARADLITPASIPSPPPLSPAVEGAPVSPNGAVWGQYEGLGVRFGRAPWMPFPIDSGTTTALAKVNGIDVWTGATYGLVSGVRVSFTDDVGVTASLVVPGSEMPTTADSVRIKLVSAGGGATTARADAYDAQGNLLVSQVVHPTLGGGWLTLTAAGIETIHVSASSVFAGAPAPGAPPPPPFTWGVAAIEVQRAPEPGALGLAFLGMLIPAVRLGARRGRAHYGN